MKTKSLLLAALVTLTIATTSCQSENISPSTIDYHSGEIIQGNNGESRTLINGNEALIDEQTTPNQEVQNTTPPASSKPNIQTGKINIMQIDSDEVK